MVSFLKRVVKRAALWASGLWAITATVGLVEDLKTKSAAASLGGVLDFTIAWPVMFIVFIPVVILASWRSMWADVGFRAAANPRQDAGEALRQAAKKAFGSPPPNE